MIMTNCVTAVQKKSAQYKAAMEKFNISSGELEMLLHEYQNLPENAELFKSGKLSFPSDAWLQEHLYAPASVVSDSKVLDIYEKNFSKPIVVNRRDSAEQIVNEASKYIDRNSIKIINTADGKYQVLVTKPVTSKFGDTYTQNQLLRVLHNIAEGTVDNAVTDFTMKLVKQRDGIFTHFYIFKPLNSKQTDAEFIESAKQYLSNILPAGIDSKYFSVSNQVKNLIRGREGIVVSPTNYTKPIVSRELTKSKSTVAQKPFTKFEEYFVSRLESMYPGIREAVLRGEVDITNPDLESEITNYFGETYKQDTVTNLRQELDVLKNLDNENLKQKASTFFPVSDKFVEFIQNLDKDENSYLKQFLNYLIDGYKKANISLQIEYANIEDSPADIIYDEGVALIRIDRAKFLTSMMMEKNLGQKAQRILAHELIHGLTANALYMHPTWLQYFSARKQDITFDKDVRKLYQIASEKISGDWYGLTNEREFVSELMTNIEFQKELAKIPYDTKSSIFDKFIDMVKKLLDKLGFDISKTLLEEALTITHDYVKFAILNGAFSYRYDYGSDAFKDTKTVNQEFLEQQNILAAQLDKVYGLDAEFTAEEFSQIAKDIVYEISDIITEVERNPEAALKYNPTVNINNITGATRQEILAQLGVRTVLDYIKANNFTPYNGVKGNPNITSRKVNKQARLICENMEAFLTQGASTFMQLEHFGIDVHNLTVNDSVGTDATEADVNNETDEDAIQEMQGNLQEHWQEVSRTEVAFDKASVMVKQALTQCYKLNSDGTPVVSQWGVRQRMDGREAMQSIMKWTQGALSLSSMITKLQKQANKNPWIQPIIDRLIDNSGKESTFQSQFFGSVSKYFQLYSVGKKDNNVYSIFEVNTHPALTEAKRGISGLYNAGVHPLFESNGKVNTTSLEQLKSLWESLQNKKYSTENASELAETLSRVSELLGYPIASETILEILNPTTFTQMTSKSLQFIIKDLEANKDNTSWQPFSGSKKENGIINNIGKFVEPLTDRLEDVVNTSFYDSGNMYQSYVTPSYVTKLIKKFSESTQEEYEQFIKDEYGKYRQFRDADGNWRNSWLELLATKEGSRQILTHKVQLNFDGNRYMLNRNGAKAMSPEELTLSIISEYFKENGHNTKNEVATAWFRIPLMSNKPSSEFIKFYSYRGADYKNRVLNGCMMLFGQELSRIQTVKAREKVYDASDPEMIENFDGKRGHQFCFFDFLNTVDNDKFHTLVNKVTDNKATEAEKIELSNLARDLIREGIQKEFDAQRELWRQSGVIEAAKHIQGIDETLVESDLENFFWNDFLAANNIFNLTITDLAYYKNTEDVQKRLAQLHAPGIRANIEARDFDGNRVADSKTRTLYLKDVEVNPKTLKSNIIENVRVVFNKRLKSIEGTAQYETAKAIYNSIIEQFEDGINVADAQGYSSPTSYRKKALLFGKWDTHSEEIYQKLMSGNYNYTDFKTAFQPLKPFVYTQTDKDSNVDDASLPTIKLGVQNKNSEYLLLMANAITQGEDTGKPNYLKAIYEIMEESHKGTTIKGKHTPRVDGIDTVQFESTVKVGLTGRIDITQAETTSEAKQLLEDLIYVNKETHQYDKTYVQELETEDYCLQQEVPEHFRDHEQQQGSQIRMITPSDLNPNLTYKVEGKNLSAEEFRNEYERNIAENIAQSIQELKDEFSLSSEATMAERNTALARILQNEILSSPRYGLDLLMSCMLDENGNFKLPLGDPIQSKRIEQLINSIVKNRVNKQKISGGPVVQVSNFGTSRQLQIIFKSEDGNPLKSLNDYLSEGKTEEDWASYIKENQAGIDHYETYISPYSSELFRDFMDANGDIDIEAIKETNPELLKMIGYRIPSEDKYSMIPMRIVGFLPKEAGDGIMLPYEVTLITGSDFDIDKMYLMRKDLPISRRNIKEIRNKLKEKFGKSRLDDINIFLDQISNDTQRDVAKSSYPDIWKEYIRIAYKTNPPTQGRQYRNNKIIDMTWEVLTHEDSADKLLNPGGFEEQKRQGYLVEASRIQGKLITELESLSTKVLKEICQTNKNLAFIGTHAQFYKQNAAAASILAIFAVAKVAHACLESNGFKVDVQEVCGITDPVSIMGLTLFDKVELDPQRDVEGNFIGKTLGSLVASAADAVKDPVLNLMNINNDTVNILNTLIRMGLPFRKAARLLSTKVVSDLLVRYNTEKLSSTTSFNRVLETMLTEISDANNNLAESDIASEDLTDEEVNDAILNRTTKSDYKILLALQRIGQINTAMRSLNFATRFNSIASAVGPLIIDNLKIEHNLNDFAQGIYTKDNMAATFDDVFGLHPILEEFANSVPLARELFGNHMPTYSTQFGNVLNALEGSTLLNTFYRDRKLFSRFNDFYQSYLLVANGVISSTKEKYDYYLKKFPAEFAEKNYKQKYADNALIDAIRFDIDKNSNNPVIKINVTGLDQETKSRLTSGWLDLYKSGDEGRKLAADLFNYCFYKGGIGFNPKTFMSLLPIQLKMRLKGYKETFSKLPEINGTDMVYQFIRNNWNDDKVVPYRKFEKSLQIHDGGFVDFYGDEASRVKNLLAFKTRVGLNTSLFVRESYDPETGVIVFKETSPLGNNGEFTEISIVSKPNSFEEAPTNPKLTEEIGSQTDEVTSREIVDENVIKSTTDLEAKTLADNLVERLNKVALNASENIKDSSTNKLEQIKQAINNYAESQGIKIDQKQVNEIASKYC